MALSPGWRVTSTTWLSVPWMAHGPARRAAVITGESWSCGSGVDQRGSIDRVEYIMDVGLTSGAVAYIINPVALPEVDVFTVAIVACRHGLPPASPSLHASPVSLQRTFCPQKSSPFSEAFNSFHVA